MRVGGAWALVLVLVSRLAFAEALMELEKIEIEETPLGGGTALSRVPSYVQGISGKDLETAQSFSISDYLQNYLGSVTVSEAQNNPFQPDIQYRGFTASPLLGVPQGLTVYFNSVRFNEPFGDTLNWDLIPAGAIERLELHPGSDPVYGLNALGGTIVVRSKTGFSSPRHQVEGYAGSFGRHNEELSSGWNNGRFGYFFHLRHLEENGWRDFSPSHVRQAFGVLSLQNKRGELNWTLSGNDNDLTGNGAVPIQLLRQEQRAVFTHPDETSNRMFFSNLDGSFWLNDKIQLSGNAYYRFNRIRTFNGDDTDFVRCEPPEDDRMCDEGGEELEDVFGDEILASEAVDSATRNFSQTRQRGYGTAFQSIFSYDLFGLENRFIAGFSFDQAQIRFHFDTELARLTESRGTEGSGILVEEPRVRLDSEVTHFGAFFVEQLTPIKDLTLTVSGRYNASHIDLKDKFGTELSGKHTFNRFNPAAGVAYQLLPALGVYGRYSVSSRAPTPVELTCADPEAPCRLPNAFLADPPLKQVVARSWEAGLRGTLEGIRLSSFLSTRFQWHTGFFLTKNHDDILFISAGDLISEGFFSNVGKTRRQGLEASLTGEVDNEATGIWFNKLRYGFNYTFLEATFRTPFMAPSPNNPAAEGIVHVNKGDRIPLLPEHVFKFSLSVDVFPQFTLGMIGIYNSDRFFRGDEANLNDPLPGFWVFNLRGEYRVNPHVQLFVRVDNLFDKRYQTFGLFGEAERVLGDEFDDARFVGPGAPRGIWGGVRLTI
ncbi:MAG: TonB-dependent receptor [Methylohalobius sp.]|nr:TonB-dependent receptor [Methylohalobius sp.]